jgi:hypothetical protein
LAKPSHISFITLNMSNPPEEPPVMDEYWQGIDGLGTYAVSNYGRVVNVKSGKDLRVRVDSDGFHRVYLYRKGKRYDVFVHLLVASVFFLNWKPGVGVDFLNGDQSDCTVANLTIKKAIRR